MSGFFYFSAYKLNKTDISGRTRRKKTLWIIPTYRFPWLSWCVGQLNRLASTLYLKINVAPLPHLSYFSGLKVTCWICSRVTWWWETTRCRRTSRWSRRPRACPSAARCWRWTSRKKWLIATGTRSVSGPGCWNIQQRKRQTWAILVADAVVSGLIQTNSDSKWVSFHVDSFLGFKFGKTRRDSHTSLFRCQDYEARLSVLIKTYFSLVDHLKSEEAEGFSVLGFLIWEQSFSIYETLFKDVFFFFP